MSSVLCLP